MADDMPTHWSRLRGEVRRFLEETRQKGLFTPGVDSWVRGHSAEFSRALGARGWLGMTWPTRYGGRARSALERFVVIEELLLAGAPVGAHWIADRQFGPAVLRSGTEEQRAFFLPPITRGELFVSAGMSEPNSGSDLASIRTRGVETADGWSVTGSKVWTTHAHQNHWLLALVRTSPASEDRHQGLTQLLIDLASPGVQVRPITVMGGEAHFTEIFLDDVTVPHHRVLGAVGAGWKQVTSELAYERSGPERYLSVFALFAALCRTKPLSDTTKGELGFVGARMLALRAMSLEIQTLLDAGQAPDVEAALVKDLGTRLEKELVEVAGVAALDDELRDGELLRHLHEARLAAPSFTLRGGTNEILRGIVAKELAR